MFNSIHTYLSNSVDWLSTHTKMAAWGFVELIVLIKFSEWFDMSAFHEGAIFAKDIGLYCGAFMTTLPAFAWVWKNIIRRIFKKKKINGK